MFGHKNVDDLKKAAQVTLRAENILTLKYYAMASFRHDQNILNPLKVGTTKC